MTIESHNRGSEGSHRVLKEDAKANDIWKKMTNEDYEREKVEMEVHIEVMMELLQQEKKEQLMNPQWEDEILKASGYQGEDLKIEASSEAKRSQCFEIDILCIFASTMNELRQFAKIVTKNEGKGKNLNSVQEDDGTPKSHSNAHAQLSESVSFQHVTKAESRKSLDYDDDSQEQDEAREEMAAFRCYAWGR